MWDRIAVQAGRQRGLITRPQLRALGVSDEACRSAVDAGELIPVRRGVYALQRRQFSLADLAHAACLQAGGLVCVSGLTAARLWELWNVDDRTIEISVRYPRAVSLTGVTTHRSRDLARTDVAYLDGIPVSTPARTLVDLGRVLPEPQVVRILDHAIASGLVVRGHVWQRRIEVSKQGRNGAGVIDRALRDLPDQAEQADSGPEAGVMRLLRDAGLPPPTPQWWTTVGHRRYRIDLAYPHALVAIEYDGRAWHGPDRRSADQHREDLLVSAGWRVIRVAHDHIESEGAGRFLEEVRSALRQRAA